MCGRVDRVAGREREVRHAGSEHRDRAGTAADATQGRGNAAGSSPCQFRRRQSHGISNSPAQTPRSAALAAFSSPTYRREQ